MTTQRHISMTGQATRLASVTAVCAWDGAYYLPKRNEQLVEGFGT